MLIARANGDPFTGGRPFTVPFGRYREPRLNTSFPLPSAGCMTIPTEIPPGSTDIWSGDIVPVAPGSPPTPSAGTTAVAFTSTPPVVPEDSLATSVIWLLGLTAAQKAVGFIRSVIVCRWLDPLNLGVWGMSQAMMDTAVPLLLLSIPGAFGRYVEFYRQRGQLPSFLRWATGLCSFVLVSGISVGLILQTSLAKMVFGDVQYRPLTAGCLFAVIPAAIFAFSTELLVGLRRGRAATCGHFYRGLLLTLVSLSLLAAWRCDASSMVWAYGLSFGLAWLLLLPVLAAVLRNVPASETPLSIRLTARRLAPAVMGFWLADFLNNMFSTVDRYMLIHWNRHGVDQALASVGNYEAALVFPLLLATVATMVARMILPHHAKDWELGRHEQVQISLNRTLQGAALALVAGGCVIRWLGPTIFQLAFRGQYPAGQGVLSWAITFYIWSALSAVVMNYLWCVEKTPWCALAMSVGLVVNVILNGWLVPRLGILALPRRPPPRMPSSCCCCCGSLTDSACDGG